MRGKVVLAELNSPQLMVAAKSAIAICEISLYLSLGSAIVYADEAVGSMC